MKTELTETLIRGMQSYAELYMLEHDKEDLYGRLTVLFNLSDEDIDAIGLGWVLPEPEEPEEEPVKEYEIFYWEKLAGRFVVNAHSAEEAAKIFDRDYLEPGIDLDDLECVDSDWILVNPD